MKKDLLRSLRDKTTDFFGNLIDDHSHRSIKKEIVQQFHQLYYNSHFFNRSDSNTYWLGIPVEKCPLDLWIFQEIIFETKPDLIIECGTGRGGTTLFLATVCEMLKNGKVVSIDKEKNNGRPEHDRIKYLSGLTTSNEVLYAVKEEMKNHNNVMVILDDDHHKEHVLKELKIYSDFVSKGNYLIVEDTNLNGNPVYPDYGQGPKEAVDEFLKENKNFEADKMREKYFLTFNPNGYLRRKS